MTRRTCTLSITMAIVGWGILIADATLRDLSIGVGRLGDALATVGTLSAFTILLWRPPSEIYAAGKEAGRRKRQLQDKQGGSLLILGLGR